MQVEFVHRGKTYETQFPSLGDGPPARIALPFRPCVLRPEITLRLAWVGTDDVRGIEIYRPEEAS